MEVRKCEVPDKWPVEDGYYFLGNKFHPVAVFIPIDDELGRRIARFSVERGVAIAGFCRTANIGIEKVICNVLANPNIRWLVVAGHECEGHRSGEAVIKLWENGLDPESRRIVGATGPSAYLPNLPLELVEEFRRQIVGVIDLIAGEGLGDAEVVRELGRVIHACIQEPENRVRLVVKGREYELFDPGAYREEPLRFSLRRLIEGAAREARAQVVYSSPYLTVVIAETIADAYHAVKRLIERHGYDQPSRYGPTREMMNVVVHVIDWLEGGVPEGYPTGSAEAVASYARDVREGVLYEGHSYTYGERLRRRFGDQLEALVEKLVRDPGTRQAVACFWAPYADLLCEAPPCFVAWQFLLRHGRLHATSYMRSHDFENAFVHDAFAIREVALYIVERLRERGLSVEPGTLTYVVGSCHVYQRYEGYACGQSTSSASR